MSVRAFMDTRAPDEDAPLEERIEFALSKRRRQSAQSDSQNGNRSAIFAPRCVCAAEGCSHAHCFLILLLSRNHHLSQPHTLPLANQPRA